MDKQLARVFEFNRAGKQDVTTTPRWIKREDFIKQMVLLKEEIQEIEDAYEAGDLPELVDGLDDTLYVLLGLVCRMGLQHEFKRGFEEVCDSNDSKIWDSNGNNIAVFKQVPDGKGGFIEKIGKPDNFVKLDLSLVFPYLKNIKDDRD